MTGRVLWAVLLLAGCGAERPRPDPTEPSGPSELSVEVTRPLSNATVISGRTVAVIVTARDSDARRLEGLGFLALRQGGGRVDSVVVSFPLQRALATDTFELAIPAAFPTNTQVDIYGLAVLANEQVLRSEPRTIVVVQCTPGTPQCDL